ncbi:glycosyltransferase family 4 protein [Schaalia meyeri]|uniref:glycosyltransferase family 4 protein n=1 Tax=Schaalia meyeri TaxID=52773 RepID=UPI0020A80284|nr:glycosyltransferase family 1 protein [Schaalia meyeri]
MSVRVGMVVEQMWQSVPGGSGRYIVEVASRLAAQGVNAIGIAARHGRGAERPEQVGLSIPVRSCALPRRALYAAWDRLGIPGVDRVLGAGSGRGADVVHATTWAIPPTSRPLIVTVHDVAFLREASHFTAHGAAYFRRALAATKKHADAVIVPSQATAADCVEAGIDEDLISVIPHGLTHTPVTHQQVEAFRARHTLNRPYILWVGTREPRKNLPTLIQAYRALAPTTELDLVLVGPAGWGEDPTEADLPASRVHVLGRLDDEDLACAYAGARVFTFPSIWEGFGLPVLEAMAHGTPVVTSEGTCMAEITGADAGLLAPATDPHALAEALQAAAGPDHDRLSAAGRERARDFTWESSAASHARLYESLAGAR